jgi:hypothetical protein
MNFDLFVQIALFVNPQAQAAKGTESQRQQSDQSQSSSSVSTLTSINPNSASGRGSPSEDLPTVDLVDKSSGNLLSTERKERIVAAIKEADSRFVDFALHGSHALGESSIIEAMEAISPSEKDNVLEVGYGTCRVAYAFAALGANVTGNEIDGVFQSSANVIEGKKASITTTRIAQTRSSSGSKIIGPSSPHKKLFDISKYIKETDQGMSNRAININPNPSVLVIRKDYGSDGDDSDDTVNQSDDDDNTDKENGANGIKFKAFLADLPKVQSSSTSQLGKRDASAFSSGSEKKQKRATLDGNHTSVGK